MSSQAVTDPTPGANTSWSTVETSTSKSISISTTSITTSRKQPKRKVIFPKHFAWIAISLFVLSLGLIVAVVGYFLLPDVYSGTNLNATDNDGNNQTQFTEAELNEQMANGTCRSCCQTDACLLYSRTLTDVMDFSVNPCDDFYKYTCGNWHKHKPPGGNVERSSHVDAQTLKLHKMLRLAVQNKPKGAPSKSNAMEYLSELYHECMNVQKREQLGIKPIRQLLKHVFGSGQWPRLNTSKSTLSHDKKLEHSIFTEFWQFWKSDNSSDFRQQTNESSSKFYGLWNFWKPWKLWKTSSMHDGHPELNRWMDLFVEATLNNLQSSIIFIQAYPDHKRKSFINIKFRQVVASEKIDRLYEDYMKYKKVISLYSKVKHKWNTSMNNAIFEVMNFNIKLAKYMDKVEPVDQYLFENIKEITLAQLNNYTSARFNWTLLLNKFATRAGASTPFTEDDLVYIITNQLELFSPITELVVSTPIRVLKNAMQLQMLTSQIDVPYKFYLTNFLNLKNRRNNNHHQKYPLSRVCMLDVYYLSDAVFIRIFVDYIGREKMLAARDEVVEIVRHIKNGIGELLQYDHSWLDDKTRQNALDKLDAMNFSIAFPNWILQDDILDERLGFDSSVADDALRIVKGHYAESYFKFMRIANSGYFRQAKAKQKHIEWNFSFTTSLARYIPALNEFGIGYGFIYDSPWFDVDNPAAINYGTIGIVIGHEVFHGFDHWGRQFDKHGKMTNWWTDSASEHFDKLANCFVAQYEGLVDPFTGAKHNGTQTLGENIADNCAIKHAYGAFEEHLQHSSNCCTSEALPPLLAQFTPEQLFFLAYGHSLCSAIKNSTNALLDAVHDVHAAEYYRTNVPVSNLAEFAQAFNCSAGSPMNPEHRCSIW